MHSISYSISLIFTFIHCSFFISILFYEFYYLYSLSLPLSSQKQKSAMEDEPFLAFHCFKLHSLKKYNFWIKFLMNHIILCSNLLTRFLKNCIILSTNPLIFKYILKTARWKRVNGEFSEIILLKPCEWHMYYSEKWKMKTGCRTNNI